MSFELGAEKPEYQIVIDRKTIERQLGRKFDDTEWDDFEQDLYELTGGSLGWPKDEDELFDIYRRTDEEEEGGTGALPDDYEDDVEEHQ